MKFEVRARVQVSLCLDFLLDKRSVKTLKNSSSLLKPQCLLFSAVEYSLDLFPSILNSMKVSFDLEDLEYSRPRMTPFLAKALCTGQRPYNRVHYNYHI